MLPRDSVALCVCGWRGRRQRRAGCASSWLLLESCDVALLGGSKLTSAWGEEVQTELCTRKYLCLNGGVARKELSLLYSWRNFKLFAVPGLQENQICLREVITSSYIGAFQKRIIMVMTINYWVFTVSPVAALSSSLISESHYKPYISKFKLILFLLSHKTCATPHPSHFSLSLWMSPSHIQLLLD